MFRITCEPLGEKNRHLMVRDDNNITGLALVAYTNLNKALKVHQIRGAPCHRSAAP